MTVACVGGFFKQPCISEPVLTCLFVRNTHCRVMQRDLQALKAASGQETNQGMQQSPLVSLDSWSQPSAEPWDAFSNHTDAASEPTAAQRMSTNTQAHSSPLSPQRQAAAARAKAFIKTQTSNVQSMQVSKAHYDGSPVSHTYSMFHNGIL